MKKSTIMKLSGVSIFWEDARKRSVKSRSGSRTRRLLSLIWVIRLENYGQETNYFILSFLEIFFKVMLHETIRNNDF